MPDSLSSSLQGHDRGSRLALPLLILAMAVLPLLLTPAIPAVDFNAHLLRYLILADDGATPFLARNYSPDWTLVMNLGLDVLGALLLSIVSPLVAGKIIAVILLFTVYGGTLFLAHAVQGQLRPITIVLAGLLMHTHIFTWGFANFLLGLGIGLAGLGLWIKTSANPRQQLLLAMLIGVGLALVHALAFGLWGIMLGAYELGRAIEQRDLSFRSLLIRAMRLASIAVIPIVLFLASTTSAAPGGVTTSFANLKAYTDTEALAERIWIEIVRRIDLLFRVTDTRFPWADRAIGLSLWALIVGGLYSGGLRLSSKMWLPALFAFLMALFIPPNLLGSGYVNDRLPLLLMGIFVAGLISSEGHRFERPLLFSAAALLVLHLSLVTVQYWRAGRHFDDLIKTVSAVDTGETAGFLSFGKSGRDQLGPLCSPSLILLALENQTAVQTFVYRGMQPLLLDGPLAVAMEREAKMSLETKAKDVDNPTTAWRQMRIGQYLEAGFDSVFVCDGVGPPPASGGFREVARGNGWAIYRRIEDIQLSVP